MEIDKSGNQFIADGLIFSSLDEAVDYAISKQSRFCFRASLNFGLCWSGNGFTLLHNFVAFIGISNPPLFGKCLRADELYV